MLSKRFYETRKSMDLNRQLPKFTFEKNFIATDMFPLTLFMFSNYCGHIYIYISTIGQHVLIIIIIFIIIGGVH